MRRCGISPPRWASSQVCPADRAKYQAEILLEADLMARQVAGVERAGRNVHRRRRFGLDLVDALDGASAFRQQPMSLLVLTEDGRTEQEHAGQRDLNRPEHKDTLATATNRRWLRE